MPPPQEHNPSSPMREVWFIVPPNLVLLDFAGPADAFRVAAAMGAPLRLRFAAALCSGEATSTSLGVGLAGFEALPASLPADALVVMCGASAGERVLESPTGRALVRWLRDVVGPAGCELACICSGAL